MVRPYNRRKGITNSSIKGRKNFRTTEDYGFITWHET